MTVRQRIRWALLALIVMALLVSVAACQPLGTRSQRASEDWARGVRLGQATISDDVALAPRADGTRVFLAWVAQRTFDGAQLLHFAQLDESGTVVAERDLDIETVRPTHVRLVLTDAGIRILWVDASDGRRRLHHALLDERGRSLGRPATAMEQSPIDAYDLAPAPGGAIDIVSSITEGEQAGLYLLRLGADGSVVSPATSLGLKGSDPVLRLAPDGSRHLAWIQQPAYGQRDLVYASLSTEGAPRQVTVLLSYPVGVGLVAHRPELVLTDALTSVFWSIERRGGGLSEPAADTIVQSFPSGRPELAGAGRHVALPAWNHPSYRAVQSPFGIQHRAPASGDTAAFVYYPYAAAPKDGEVPIAFSVQLSGRTQDIVQILLSYWQGGEIAGYQIVGQTTTSSLRPVLVADGHSNLHLAWIDTAGFGAYDVYYASTSPGARARLNQVTLGDVGARLLTVLWSVVQAVGFLPVVLAWSLISFLMVVIYVFFVPESYMSRRGPRVMLAVAIIPYVLLKYSLRPGWLMHLPLPGSVSPQATEYLLLTVPLVISLLAGAATIWLIRRRGSTTILPAFGIFVLTDALLTLLVYVPGVLAE